jgi:NAD(P)-dependent dehydrogenase (short-subunit alcohol dehydrogenase family)
MASLANKTALVTRGSRGIGRAACHGSAKSNWLHMHVTSNYPWDQARHAKLSLNWVRLYTYARAALLRAGVMPSFI